MLLAAPLLQLLATKGVDEVLCVRLLLLLDEPGGEEGGKKQQKYNSAQHVEDSAHAALS